MGQLGSVWYFDIFNTWSRLAVCDSGLVEMLLDVNSTVAICVCNTGAGQSEL